MADRWGRASYPGALSVQRCTYTAFHGITPGCAVLDINPQANLPAGIGDLVIFDGVGTVRIRGMRLDTFKIVTNNSGQVISLELEDRRWQWRDLGAISGEYNQLDPNGKLIPWTVRSPYELCVLLLRVMGERRFVIDMPPGLTSAVGRGYNDILRPGQLLPPTGVNPPIVWNAENPAQALQRFAEYFGRRIVYDPVTDSVMVVRVGNGKFLPNHGSIASDSPSARFPQIPDACQVVGDATRYQGRFELEPVGREWDGSYRPINQLSYAPRIAGENHKWTYTPTTTAVPSRFYLTLPDFGQTFEFTATALDDADDVVNAFKTLIDAVPAVTQEIVASASSGVLTLTAKRQGYRFEMGGYCGADPALVPGDGNTEPSVTRVLQRESSTVRRGWDFCHPPLFVNVESTERLTYAQAQSLAQDSVWKCYRLSGRDVSGRGPINVPGYGLLKRRQQLILLPSKVDQIIPEQADRQLLDSLGRPIVLNYYDGLSKDRPAQVFGAVDRIISAPNFWVLRALDSPNTPENEAVYVPFRIDPLYQVVTFGTFVYKNEYPRFVAPRLFIETAVNVRDPDTNAPVCFVSRVKFSNPVRRVASVRRPDVQLNVTATYNADGTIRETRILEADPIQRASYYLTGMTVQYFVHAVQTREFNGIEPIALDGAITQVSWMVDGSGCKTVASRNTEHDLNIPPFPARRRAETLRPDQQLNLYDGANPQRKGMTDSPQRPSGDAAV